MHVSVGGRCNNVIEACKNKEYVELAGYNGSILDELKGVLSKVDLVPTPRFTD